MSALPVNGGSPDLSPLHGWKGPATLKAPMEKHRITGFSKGNYEGEEQLIRVREDSLAMVNALYLRISFPDNNIPHLIA
jgi:hypothetical protein